MPNRPPSPARLRLESVVKSKADAITDAIVKSKLKLRQDVKTGLGRLFSPRHPINQMPPAIPPEEDDQQP